MATCAHCTLDMVGHASQDGHPLCHPDTGLDCYRLVSVYRHPMPCTWLPCRASILARTAREAAGAGAVAYWTLGPSQE